MAGDLEELDSVVTLVVLLAIVGGVGYLVYLLWPLIKTLLADGKSGLSPSETQSVFQSLKNAMDGFPDGADPGGVPAFQYAQGVVESFRNAHDMLFGSNPEQDDDVRTAGGLVFGNGDDTDDLAPDDILYLAPQGSTAETAPLKAPTAAQFAGAQGAIDGFEQWATSPGNVGDDVTSWFLSAF